MGWIKQFILYHDKRHPNEMGAVEVEQFLTHLATARNVAYSTKNQALSVLLFLYRDVLGVDLLWVGEFSRSKVLKRLPVFSLDSVRIQLPAALIVWRIAG